MSVATRRAAVAGLVIAAGCALATGSVRAAPPPSAAELARSRVETRLVETEFIARVAHIVGVETRRIEALLPEEPRIADRGRWLVQAIGIRIRPLDEAEKTAILDANRARLAALEALRRR